MCKQSQAENLNGESIPGIVNCLKCKKEFKSKDKTRLRICAECKTHLSSSDKYVDLYVSNQHAYTDTHCEY